MDSDQWLEFTVFTGIDKYKSKISKMIKDSKKFKNNFDYMRLISIIYLDFEYLIDELEAILK